MNRKEFLNNIAEELFETAKGLGLFMAEIVFTPYGQLRIRKISRTTYYRRLEKFEQNGLVKKIRKQRGAVYVLTEKAKELRQKPRAKMNRIDGLSTMIIFDIPEEKHKARDNFRRYLLKNGYTQIQKSVFMSPYKVFDEMNEFIRELGIVDCVTFIAGKIDRAL